MQHGDGTGVAGWHRQLGHGGGLGVMGHQGGIAPFRTTPEQHTDRQSDICTGFMVSRGGCGLFTNKSLYNSSCIECDLLHDSAGVIPDSMTSSIRDTKTGGEI